MNSALGRFVIKRSPIVLIGNFVVIQVAITLAYFVAGYSADFGELWNGLGAGAYLPYNLGQLLLISLAEVVILLFVFFRWHRDYFIINASQIKHVRGIIAKHETIIPFNSFVSVSFDQNILGRVMRYGTIRLSGGKGAKPVSFSYIPAPKDFVGDLLEFKDTGLLTPDQGGPEQAGLDELLTRDEHEQLEFKSSLRWDTHTGKVNRTLEKATLKTVSAFLNSRGGYLVIGVDDQRRILGVENDYKTIQRPDADGFEIHFSNIFNSSIGAQHRQFVKLARHQADGKDCFVVSVAPSTRPAYLATDDNEEFFIRTGNGTTSLKVSEAHRYIDSRFKKA